MHSKKEKPIQKPSLEIPVHPLQPRPDLEQQLRQEAEPKPEPVEQSEDLTREVFEEHKDDADPEKHRGNFQGGFKYDKGEKK